jgi:class 3 adenylate cyclase
MSRLQRRRFSEPDEVRRVPNGTVEVVSLDDRIVGRMTYQPGWRWSVDVKPVAATASCQFHHVGVTTSGRLRVQMIDGVELELAPGDVFEIPPGHDAWVIGDEPWVSVDFEAMRSYARPSSESGKRRLASILFTDIVDSTAHAVALGPAAWRDLVGRHNELAERLIDQRDGQLIKTTGDGVIALFDSAEAALQAGLDVIEGMRLLDIQLRAGVHTGEVEIAAQDVRGLAVHAAARIVAVAPPGALVASAAVREILDGSSLEFEDLGQHELKGLPGKRSIFRVTRAAAMRRRPPAGAQ